MVHTTLALASQLKDNRLSKLSVCWMCFVTVYGFLSFAIAAVGSTIMPLSYTPHCSLAVAGRIVEEWTLEWQQEERPFRTRLDFGAVYKRMVYPPFLCPGFGY